MHSLKELRKNLDNFKKKFDNRNTDFDINDFKKKDASKKLYQNQKTNRTLKNLKKYLKKF